MKRFKQGFFGMDEHKSGEWVKFNDATFEIELLDTNYNTICARKNKVEKELSELEQSSNTLKSCYDEKCAELSNLDTMYVELIEKHRKLQADYDSVVETCEGSLKLNSNARDINRRLHYDLNQSSKIIKFQAGLLLVLSLGFVFTVMV